MIVPSSFHINVLSLCIKGIYFELRTGRPHIGFEIKRFLTVDFLHGSYLDHDDRSIGSGSHYYLKMHHQFVLVSP